MQKLKCPTCGRILGGKATTKKNGNTYFYYRCLVCKNNIQESSIEKSFIEILNDVVEYDGIVNNYFVPLLRNKINSPKIDYDSELASLKAKEDRIRRAYINGSFSLDIYNQEMNIILDNIKEVEKLKLQNAQLSNRTFSEDDILVYRDIDYINKIKYKQLYDKSYRIWSNLTRIEKKDLVMKYIDTIELKQLGSITIANKINFKDIYYKRFMDELFDNGLIDKPLLPSTEYGPTIRYNHYLDKKKVEENFKKLNKEYNVDLYYGTFNNDSKMLNIKMPDNYDIVRIFPTEEKTDTEILNMGAICISKDLLQEIDYDIEFADEILIDKYKEISKCNDEDIIFVGN